jgi:MFS transporter, FHS family, glucose/mannose:H+ symporter
MKTSNDNRDRLLTVLLHAVFFLSGIMTVLIGQVLPILANRFALNDLESGYLFPAQFAGSLTGTLLTNWFGKYGRLVQASAIGSGLMAGGVLMINSGSYEVVLTGFLVNGLGVGLTLPAINILILERNPQNSAAALSFLNFFWGLGAIVSKPFVDATAKGTSLYLTTIILAVPLFIGVFMIFAPARAESRPPVRSENGDVRVTPIWSTPLAWAITAFNFIHIGFESGMGGWLTTYTDRVEGDMSTHLLSPTLLFFLFFVIGRGIAPVFFNFLNENQMLLLSLLVILAGLAITLTAGSILQLGIGAAICGFGTSSVFPTNVSRFSKTFGADAMRRSTPLFLCGTLGATLVTWLIGFLSNQTGSLRSGMFVLVFSILFLLVLQIGLSVSARNQKAVK